MTYLFADGEGKTSEKRAATLGVLTVSVILPHIYET